MPTSPHIFKMRNARDEMVLHNLSFEKALDQEKAIRSQRRAKRDHDRGKHDVEPHTTRAEYRKSVEKPLCYTANN